MDPPDTTAPLFGGNGDLAGAAAAVDLDEIFEDCFAANEWALLNDTCLLYTSPSPRDKRQSRMPSSA